MRHTVLRPLPIVLLATTAFACSAPPECPPVQSSEAAEATAVGAQAMMPPPVFNGGDLAAEIARNNATAARENASLEADRVRREMEARAYPNSPDADGDGHYDVRYGGDDCCDADANAFPGARGFFTRANACENFDYDCSGSEDPQYGVASAEARGLRCGTSGFDRETACGEGGDLTTYTWRFGCKAATSAATQACR